MIRLNLYFKVFLSTKPENSTSFHSTMKGMRFQLLFCASIALIGGWVLYVIQRYRNAQHKKGLNSQSSVPSNDEHYCPQPFIAPLQLPLFCQQHSLFYAMQEVEIFPYKNKLPLVFPDPAVESKGRTVQQHESFAILFNGKFSFELRS